MLLLMSGVFLRADVVILLSRKSLLAPSMDLQRVKDCLGKVADCPCYKFRSRSRVLCEVPSFFANVGCNGPAWQGLSFGSPLESEMHGVRSELCVYKCACEYMKHVSTSAGHHPFAIALSSSPF